MKILNKLIALVLLNSFVFGAESTTPETQYTIGVNNTASCLAECPPVKDGYFTRKAGFNYDTGETSCYVYSVQNPSGILATVVNKNPHCAKELINTNATTNIESNTGAVNSHLNSVRQNILEQYTNAGNSTYVNLPKYIVAGLMADDTIIDIPTSISSNEVTLNSSYSNVPNLALGNGLGGILDSELINKTQGALADSVTFIINFLSSSDKILLSFKVTLFLFVVALSLIFLISQKATKKISQVGDHEDVAEKVLFGVGSILVFFLSLNRIDTSTGQISQTGYQQLIRPLLYLGVETADKLTETATSSVLKYKFSEVGVVATEDLKSLQDQKFKAEKRIETYSAYLEYQCNVIYDVTKLKDFVPLVGVAYNYPSSEYIHYDGKILGNNAQVGFYNKNFFTNENYIKQNGIPSVSFCYKMERSILENKKKISDLNVRLKAYTGDVNSDIQKKINLVTDLTYRNVAELGFLSVGNLATTTMAFNNFGLIDKNEELKNRNNFEEITKKTREATGYTVSNIVELNEDSWIPFQETMNETIRQAPLMMLPFADSLKNFVRDMFSPLIGSKGQSDSRGVIGGVADFLANYGIIGKAFGTLIETGLKFTSESLVVIITLMILTNLVAIAPLIAIIGASFMVIAFYFLSVEILYIVIPFASVFAFSTGNVEILKTLVKNTFLLAIRPVLIVVSVIMALFVYDMFSNLNEILISSMFEPLFALANDLTESASFFSSDKYVGIGNSAIFLFIQSLMLVGSSILTIFVCFYLVFNGANIMLDLLGMRDGGFDVGGVIGDKSENKHSVSKMNTVI